MFLELTLEPVECPEKVALAAEFVPSSILD